MRVAILVLLCFAALVSCAPGGAAVEFYVVIKPEETAKFIGAVTSIAKENGLETATSQTTFDTGEVLRVLEGRRPGLRLWVQNVVLSGNADPKLCGVHREAYPDPAQFVVFTEPRLLGFKSASVELGGKVSSKIRGLGFDVLRKPVICGATVVRSPP
ncbi:MAG TPA: hypothetical protein VFW40_07970 [Capsulimonadaceae bacterium]|nr:hypothetical protein [Capsulimonadaceae bacterium]